MDQLNWVDLSGAAIKLSVAEKAALDKAAEKGAVGAITGSAPFVASYVCDPITGEADCGYNETLVLLDTTLADLGGADFRVGCAAATDLCLRLRSVGSRVLECPQVVRVFENSPKPKNEDRLADVLLLRVKYGAADDIIVGFKLLLKAFLHPAGYGVNRRKLASTCILRFEKFFSLLRTRASCKGCAIRKRGWNGAELGFPRGEYLAVPQSGQPLISIITRTHNRPETLRKTLESLRLQTYRNFEIVLVEDGKPTAERMVRRDFSDLPIHYRATGDTVGRAEAFNVGMRMARGIYLNMLDDDDFLASDHLELGVAKALQTAADMIFLRDIALETTVRSLKPYEFEVHGMRMLDFPRINPFVMVRQCVTTNHSVLFKKELVESLGGMRKNLQAHEDWNLWLRMMARGSWATVPYATNYYVVPFDNEEESARLKKYALYDDQLLEDELLCFETTQEQLKEYEFSVYHDYAYLETLGVLEQHLTREAAESEDFLARAQETTTFSELREVENVILSGKQLKALYCTMILQLQVWEKEGVLSSKLRRYIKEHPMESNT